MIANPWSDLAATRALEIVGEFIERGVNVYGLYPVDDFLDYFAPPIGAGKPIPGKLLPHLACPTTSGTGSECTSVSVIRINDLNTKFVLGNPLLMPDEALVDPGCCDSLTVAR